MSITQEIELRPFMQHKMNEAALLRETYIKLYMEIYKVELSDLKIVERFQIETDHGGASTIRSDIFVERKENDSPKEEVVKREDTGNLRVGFDSSRMGTSGPERLYCDRCGCYLGRTQQD